MEENILSEGVVINPIITWNGVIVDGHNRYRIIQQHPEIKFTIHEKQFEHQFEALAWICKNQLGRRNLTPAQKKYLLGKMHESRKKTQGSNNQYIQAKSEKHQNDVFHFSLSKNFQYAPVSGIIKETGVLLWNNGEKTQEVKQLSWI